MEFSEEWKSLWPIGSVFSPPLLLHSDEVEQPSPPPFKRLRSQEDDDDDDDDDDEDGGGGRGGKTHEELGPLIFIPSCKTLVELFSSPDLAPRFPLPYPGLSLSRFLHTSGASLLPSTARSISSEFGPQLWQTESNDENFGSFYNDDLNCLQLLPCCELSRSVLAFFPTGENGDQVGYVMLRFDDSQLSVKINEVTNKIFVANEKLNHRILKLSLNPIDDFDDNSSGSGPSSFAVIGYLMACSMHSVHWYMVKTIREPETFRVKSALLEFLGSKSFTSSAIVHSCWSPHLSEESVVLLETGEFYLFDLSSCLRRPLTSKTRVGRKRLQVLWDEVTHYANNSSGCWLSCEFSWHPRILVVAHTTAVFLVDARSEGCNVSCLLKIRMLSTIQNDGFIALSRAGSDGFNFCVASKRMLLLCDVRQPWRPLLQWIHNLDNPRYLTVFGLSKLRSSSKDETYKWASESGSCILLGSFWNCEFSLFIYGPNNSRRSVSFEISKFCNSFYAWGLPSELPLSGCDCHCGSCLLRDEFLKDSLPNWTDWRQKKDVVLGFAILPLAHFAELPTLDNCGGFLLLRLMSSGKLEAQSYCAASKLSSISSEAHFKLLFNSDANLFYDIYGFDYDLEKKFQILKLDNFVGYLKGNLAEILVQRLKQFHKAFQEKEANNESSQEFKTNGSGGLNFSRSFDALINLPISTEEITLRFIWSQLQLSFPSQSFLRVAECLSFSQYISRFSFRPSEDLCDSLLPPPFLLTLDKLSNANLWSNVVMFSAESEIKLHCDRILEIVGELHHGHGISLSDETDELTEGGENLQNISLHEPEALLEELLAKEMAPTKSGAESKRFTNFIFRNQQQQVCGIDTEMAGQELLDKGCPLALKFTEPFSEEQLQNFKLLKERDLKFQKDFILYQEFITKL